MESVQKYEVKSENHIARPISVKELFVLYILNMKQAGVVCCMCFASRKKNENNIFCEGKNETLGCPPVPAGGRDVFVLARCGMDVNIS